MLLSRMPVTNWEFDGEQGDGCLKDLTKDIDDLMLKVSQSYVSITSVTHHGLPVLSSPRFTAEFGEINFGGGKPW